MFRWAIVSYLVDNIEYRYKQDFLEFQKLENHSKLTLCESYIFKNGFKSTR